MQSLWIRSRALGALCVAVLAFGPFLTLPVAEAQPALTASQSDALNRYNKALSDFKSIVSQRRAQIDAKQPLPNVPGQALYLARNAMMSTYKDLTDAMPAKIGRSNKFGIPPAYFDADTEPLIDEYLNLFRIMQAPPANAQNSETPFKDVVDLATAIARARGLDAANADIAGRIALGILPRPMAIRTSAMRVPTSTREAFRPACLKVKAVKADGRRSSRRLRLSIRR